MIYDSTDKNGPPSNLVSGGPEAYAFASIGDTITFDGSARKLTNATVTLSSWGCVTGSWIGGYCSTPSGALVPSAALTAMTANWCGSTTPKRMPVSCSISFWSFSANSS